MKRRYSPEEDEAIRRHYPSRGARWDGWDVYLPGRDRNSIQLRAQRIGVRCVINCRWSREEEDALAANYSQHPRSWPGWRTVLPHRSWTGIQLKATKMGLVSARTWTDEDRRVLMRHILSASRETGHTPKGCIRQLYLLDKHIKGGRMPVIEGGVVRDAEGARPKETARR